MIRLCLTVEGQTEEGFVRDILLPHLLQFDVLTVTRLVEFSRSKGRINRGGVRKYVNIKHDILSWAKECSGNDVRFSSMLDLYALPSDWPGFADAREIKDPYTRVRTLETAMGDDLGDWRFTPHIQLHEFEALLFADASKFAVFYVDSRRALSELSTIANSVTSPELIDDGPTTAPSKQIIARLPQYEREKPLAGPQIAAEIGLATMREKCPHFDQWIRQLEQLGKR